VGPIIVLDVLENRKTVGPAAVRTSGHTAHSPVTISTATALSWVTIYTNVMKSNIWEFPGQFYAVV
jgi:hypothetical protein